MAYFKGALELRSQSPHDFAVLARFAMRTDEPQAIKESRETLRGVR
jgi:hypothetical protein